MHDTVQCTRRAITAADWRQAQSPSDAGQHSLAQSWLDGSVAVPPQRVFVGHQSQCRLAQNGLGCGGLASVCIDACAMHFATQGLIEGLVERGTRPKNSNPAIHPYARQPIDDKYMGVHCMLGADATY